MAFNDTDLNLLASASGFSLFRWKTKDGPRTVFRPQYLKDAVNRFRVDDLVFATIGIGRNHKSNRILLVTECNEGKGVVFITLASHDEIKKISKRIRNRL